MSESSLKRYLSIDLIRGFALFANVFVHIFTDTFNLGPITSNLFSQPVSMLMVFVAIGYFGSFGSLFILISATGNLFSMQSGYEKGKSAGVVAKRQIVSGIILLIFSFLVEGIFQFYGFFGTFFGWNGHAFDTSRIIWHAFSETPVMCLAVCTIVTGVVQYFLAKNDGHLKIKRNIIVYIILSLLVVVMTQPIWNLCKMIVTPQDLTKFPSAPISYLYPGTYPGDWKVDMPAPNASFIQYITMFFITISAGSNHPIFPYMVTSFVGSIIGLLIVNAKKQSTPDPHMPKYGIYAGLIIAGIGAAFIPILGVNFSSVLPVNSIGDITGINNGLDGFWFPWWTFLLAGEIIVVFLVLRLIEYRGASMEVAPKTTFLRRFGMPAFSVYAWHRFWSAPAIILITTLIGQSVLTAGGQITGEGQFGWSVTIVLLLASWASCGLILIAWEKVGYIGGIEWMMGEVAAIFGPNFRKSKGSQKENAKWWEHGKMDVDKLFYHPQWLDIIPRDEAYKERKSGSILAFKVSILGLFIGLFAIIGLAITRQARREEGANWHNKQAFRLSVIGIIVMVVVIVVLSSITLPMLGIHF